LAGVWVRGTSKKCGTPDLFLQPLKLNVKFGTQLGVEEEVAKTTFRTKFGRDMGQGAPQKNWDPLLISATVEFNDFKFGIQLGSAE